MREGVAQAKDGAAALVPGGRPEEQAAADDPGTTIQAERRLRLQGLAGMTVLGSDGKTVGRVRDIYQQDASGELAAITVMPRQLSARSVLIPWAAIAALPAEHPADPADRSDSAASSDPADGSAPTGDTDPADGTGPADDSEIADPHSADVVRLRINAATAKAGLRPPDTGHATPQMLRESTEVLGLAAATNDADADADARADVDASDAPAPAAGNAPETPGARKAAEDA